MPAESVSTFSPERFKVAAAFWLGLPKVGIAPAAVLRESRLPASVLSAPSYLVSTEQFFSLWQAVGQLSPDPVVGLKLGTRFDAESYHPLITAARHARDYRDCLLRMARYKQFCSPEEMLVTESGKEAVIEFRWPLTTQDEPPALTDAAFGIVVELGRVGTGTRITPKRVELKRPRTRDNAHEQFFGCPVKFRSRRNAVVLERSDLDRGFVTHNAELSEMLGQSLERELQGRQTRANVSGKVKWALKRLLAGHRPELGDVARELGLSTRSLQRKIKTEGANFRQLLEEARKELVRDYLREPAVGISEAAYLLGYDDPNSFFRAFRSWEGTTPARWREAIQRDSAKSAAGRAD